VISAYDDDDEIAELIDTECLKREPDCYVSCSRRW